jgi:signal transduction histidine kinase
MARLENPVVKWYMADGLFAEPVILPEPSPQTPGKRARAVAEKDVNLRLGEIVRLISEGKPTTQIIETAVTSIAEFYRLTEIFLEVRDEELWKAARFVTLGLPKDRAKAIIHNITSGYRSKDLILKLMDDKFRVSRNGYYIPAEAWLKFAAADPLCDHPAYYKHPEGVSQPRKNQDEWHAADYYWYAVRDNDGVLLATVDIGSSLDEKLLDSKTVADIEVFIAVVALVLLKEKGHAKPVAQVALSSQRTDLLEDVLKIASSIVSERDLRKLSNMILSSVSSLFGFGRVTLVVYDEALGSFKWMAVFGYGEDAEQAMRYRTIPTDVIFEDLRESKRIGRSVYLTYAEDVNPAFRSYYISPMEIGLQKNLPRREKGEMRREDFLAFALHDSTGRIVGVIYPSVPKDGKVPDKDAIETVEIFTSLAEVALENARLAQEKEEALRISSQRTEQLSRILDLSTGIMYVRDLDQMLDSLLKTLARLLGIKRMTMGVKHADEGVYVVEAIYGYSPKAAEAIKKFTYPVNYVDTIIETGQTPLLGSTVKWRTKIGRISYYMPAEGQRVIPPEELPYYPEPELIRLPRGGKGKWHELDYIDTLILDKNGLPMAYIEILKPRDDHIPDADTIEVIEIFASLAGIAIENARLFQEHIDSRRDSELYSDILSHDIKNFNQAILGYLDLLRMRTDKPEKIAIIDKIGEQVMNTSWLASNVRTMSRVTFGDVELSRTDLGMVLLECARSVSQYYPARKITCKTDVSQNQYFIEADELVRELFTNILTNAVKYDSHEPLVIEIAVQGVFEGNHKYWLTSIADHGIGVPDEIKGVIFDRFSKAPKKKGSGMGLHIVKTLARRYEGTVWVEDRVREDFAQGAVFKVKLPAVQ